MICLSHAFEIGHMVGNERLEKIDSLGFRKSCHTNTTPFTLVSARSATLYWLYNSSTYCMICCWYLYFEAWSLIGFAVFHVPLHYHHVHLVFNCLLCLLSHPYSVRVGRVLVVTMLHNHNTCESLPTSSTESVSHTHLRECWVGPLVVLTILPALGCRE